MDGLLEETDIGCEWPDGEVEAKSRCFHQVGTCGAMGHQLEQDRMVFPCVVAPLTLIQCTLYIHMLVRDDIVALENKIELVSPVNYRILVNYDW